MSTSLPDRLGALSEKEKQTLRLIVRGHDAKSAARDLGLSVHTVNERLRDVRRKMSVSSSREAARLLFEAEDARSVAPYHQSSADAGIGEDGVRTPLDQDSAPISGAASAYRGGWIVTGVFLMTLALALIALAASPSITATAPPMPAATQATPTTEAADTARWWLSLLDQARWEDSYRATGSAFQKLNTVEAWAAASEQARRPLGAMISRTFLSEEDLPAPPHGYQVVKFRTRFANKAEAVETVTFDRENGSWRVVGVTIG